MPTHEGPDTIIEKFHSKIAPNSPGIFSFSGSDSWNFTDEDELVFSWRIAKNIGGIEKIPWSEFSAERTIVTSPLPHGKYIFQVRAMDRDRNIDPSPASVHVEVLAPIWLSYEFLIPLFMLLIIAAYSLRVGFRQHRALKFSELRYRDLVDNALTIILKWNVCDRITFWNEYAERLFGFTEKRGSGNEYIGNHLSLGGMGSGLPRGSKKASPSEYTKSHSHQNEKCQKNRRTAMDLLVASTGIGWQRRANRDPCFWYRHYRSTPG